MVAAQVVMSVLLAVAVGGLLGVIALIAPILGVVLVVAAVAAVFIIPRPIYLCYVMVLAVAFTSGMARGGFIPFLIPNELFLVLAFGLVTLHTLVWRAGRSIPTAVFIATVILLLGTTVIPTFRYVQRGFSLSVSDYISLAATVQFVLLFWIFVNIPRTDRQRRLILQLMIGTGAVIALVGLLQATRFGPIISFLNAVYPSPHTTASVGAGRITSLLGAWNALGTFLMMNLLLIAALYNDETDRRCRRNMQFSAALSIICLIGTGSYAGVVGLIVGYAIIKYFDPRGLKATIPFLGLAAVGIIIMFPLVAQRTAWQFGSSSGWVPQTLAYRFTVWEEIYLPIIAQNPVWGVSPTTEGLDWRTAESQYLFQLFSTGVVGLTGHLLWVGILIWWSFHQIRTNTTWLRSLAIFMLAILVVLSIMGLTNSVFSYSVVIDYVWIVLAVLANSQEPKVHVAT